MMKTTSNDLPALLNQIGLRATAEGLDDLIARASKGRWTPHQLLEQMARQESDCKARKNLVHRMYMARLGRFKPMIDFDWNWPKKIDRELIERYLTGDFISEARNLVVLGANGLGKTMIVQNIAHNALLAGQTVWFRTASDLISDLSCDSPTLRRNKLNAYGRVHLLCIDELAYLSYDSHAADLIYEVVNRRYECGSIVLTTNRAFKDWNDVFPHATSIATMLDRLLHHADICLIEGDSYRMRESEKESKSRKKK